MQLEIVFVTLQFSCRLHSGSLSGKHLSTYLQLAFSRYIDGPNFVY